MGAKNRIGAGLSLGGDVGDDGLAVVGAEHKTGAWLALGEDVGDNR